MAVDAVNNWEEELFSASCLGTVELIDVLDDQIILQVNGKEFSRTVEEWELAAEEAEEMLSNTGTLPIDFSDISYWRTGHYDATFGAYCLNQNRICLNDLIENTAEQYRVVLSCEDYKIAIREYNERRKITGSAELGDGEVYIPSEGTVYLGISIYNIVQEKGITFSQYEELFADGLMVGFNLGATVSNEENEAEEVPEEVPEEEIKKVYSYVKEVLPEFFIDGFVPCMHSSYDFLRNEVIACGL